MLDRVVFLTKEHIKMNRDELKKSTTVKNSYIGQQSCLAKDGNKRNVWHYSGKFWWIWNLWADSSGCLYMPKQNNEQKLCMPLMQHSLSIERNCNKQKKKRQKKDKSWKAITKILKDIAFDKHDNKLKIDWIFSNILIHTYAKNTNRKRKLHSLIMTLITEM